MRTVMLQQINQFSNFVNALVYRFPVLSDCGATAAWCAPDEFLSVLQLFGQWAIVMPLMIYYLRMHPDSLKKEEAEPLHSVNGTDPDLPGMAYNTAWWCILAFAVYMIVISLTTVLLLWHDDCGQAVTSFADVLGYLCCALVVIQYTPQLVLTYQTGKAGGLSILTIAIQAPGSILFAIVQVTQGNSISTWMATAVAGAQLCFLLAMLIWFECCATGHNTQEGTNDGLEEDCPEFHRLKGSEA